MPPSSMVGVFDPYAPRFAPWATYITSVARTATFPAEFKARSVQVRRSTNANAAQIVAAAIAPKTRNGTIDTSDARVSLNRPPIGERPDNSSHNTAMPKTAKAVACIQTTGITARSVRRRFSIRSALNNIKPGVGRLSGASVCSDSRCIHSDTIFSSSSFISLPPPDARPACAAPDAAARERSTH